jgi:hypothetical protein
MNAELNSRISALEGQVRRQRWVGIVWALLPCFPDRLGIASLPC